MRSERKRNVDADFDLAEARKAKEMLDRFYEATGVSLYEWNFEKEAARFNRFRANEKALEESVERMKHTRADVQDVLDALDEALTAPPQVDGGGNEGRAKA